MREALTDSSAMSAGTEGPSCSVYRLQVGSYWCLQSPLRKIQIDLSSNSHLSDGSRLNCQTVLRCTNILHEASLVTGYAIRLTFWCDSRHANWRRTSVHISDPCSEKDMNTDTSYSVEAAVAGDTALLQRRRCWCDVHFPVPGPETNYRLFSMSCSACIVSNDNMATHRRMASAIN